MDGMVCETQTVYLLLFIAKLILTKSLVRCHVHVLVGTRKPEHFRLANWL